MTASALENLLLKPQATELSYQYIETLVINRIEKGELRELEGHDDFVALLDVFTKLLYRAGSGWSIVVAKRVSTKIVLALLKKIIRMDTESDKLLAPLSKLLLSSPILIKCNYTKIIAELTRLVRDSSVPSVNLWKLVHSVLIHELPGNIELYTIASKVIATLLVCRTGYEASLCLEVIRTIQPYISRDKQLLNTTLGVITSIARKFVDNIAVIRLVNDISKSTSSVRTDAVIESVVLPKGIPEQPINEPIPSAFIPEEPIMVEEEIVSHANHLVDDDDGKSSCPSLDL